jgi:hypothetical protein
VSSEVPAERAPGHRGHAGLATGRYAEAERLLEHAAGMLGTDVAPEERAELVARQAVIVAMASAHLCTDI